MNIDEIIALKEQKKLLTEKEIDYVVSGFTKGFISKEDMSKFLLLIKEFGLSYKETFFLTKAMVESGDIIDLSKVKSPIVDKHSTGGVGDKTTIIVGPIVASLGIAVAKMSGKSLGFTGGTIDKLESINGYKTNLCKDEFIENVNKINICLIGQTEKIAVADKKIYALRDEIDAVESIPLIASSIMSKKIASGANKIVIDLKVGAGAFMKNTTSAKMLAKTMIKIGKYYKRKVVCILTDMDVPLGRTIGNSLEIKEAINYFDGVRDYRLDRLVKYISTYMVSLGKQLSIRKSYELVCKSLEDGKAKNKFYEWIKNQGGDLRYLKGFVKQINIVCEDNGYINSIDAIKIASLVHSLGAGRNHIEDSIDYGVGFEIKCPLHSKVKKGDIIGSIYYTHEIGNMVREFYNCFQIGRIKNKERDIIISVIK